MLLSFKLPRPHVCTMQRSRSRRNTGNVFLDVLRHHYKIALGLGNHRAPLDGPPSQGCPYKGSLRHLQLDLKPRQNLPLLCKTLKSSSVNATCNSTDEHSLQGGVCLRPQRSEKAAFYVSLPSPRNPYRATAKQSKGLRQQRVTQVAVPS